MEVWKGHQVFNFQDFVVLEVEVFDPFFSFQQRNMLEAPRIELYFFWILQSLFWPPVDDQDIGNLGKLDIQGKTVGLNMVQLAMLEQVAISFIVLRLKKLSDQFGLW